MAKEKNKTELPQVPEGELQARLIKLREDAGYSISQMASALCLSEEVIVNLENEAFDLLPEPPYVRGYLRNYAKLGEDNSSVLINCYEALRGADASELDYQIKAPPHIDIAAPKRLSPVLAQLILLAFLLVGIGSLIIIPGTKQWFQNTWQNFSTQLQTQPSEGTNNPLLTGTMPVPIPLPLPLPQDKNTTVPNPDKTSINSNSQNLSTKNSDNVKVPAATPESTEAVSENTNAVPDPVTETQEKTEKTAQTINAPINIKLVFNKDVWLRIKNKDNKTVFEGLNKTGTEKTLDLEKPLTFRVGNAHYLSLFIDDKAVDISTYINGSIANFTLE